MTPPPVERYEFSVPDGINERLDLWLGRKIQKTRSQLKRLIDRGYVLVNGAPTKAGLRIQAGDRISVVVPKIPQPTLKPEPIPLEIVYEDEWLAVVNKPQGLVVHPGPGNWEGTLVNALLFRFDKLAARGGKQRPGIVHRLDKGTSGLMVIAKTNESHLYLTSLMKKRLVDRHYLAVVQGVPSLDEGVISKPIGRHPKIRKKMAVVDGGRKAETIYQVMERFRRHSLVLCRLVTGRTHQIRVHLASIHHPVVGDPVYGFRTNNLGAASQALHASYLAFRDPRGKFLEFRSDPPPEFLAVLEKARMIN